MIGNQDRKRAELSGKLKSLWSSGPEVSFNMNVKNGIFRVAMTEDEVIGYLNDEPIKTLKIAELDTDIRELLQTDPEEAGVKIMESLIDAHKEGNIHMKNDIQKKAQVAMKDSVTGEEQTADITQKQLENAGTWKRKDQERGDVTEKQLGSSEYEGHDHAKRVDEEPTAITESQLEAGRNPNPNTSPRENNPREDITQKQLEGSGISSRRDYEPDGITQKQLEKDFRNDEITSITEKQLGGSEQPADKNLVRRLASKQDALEFAKRVAASTAKTVRSNEITTEEAIDFLKRSVKGFKAQTKLATLIAQAVEDEAIELDMEEPEGVAADILSDEEVGGTYDATLIVDVLRSLVENEKFPGLVDEAIADAEGAEQMEPEVSDDDMLNDALEDLSEEPAPEEPAPEEPAPEEPAPEEPVALTENTQENIKAESVEEGIEVEGSSDDDGLIAVEGDLSEIKGKDKKSRTASAFAYARKVAGSEIPKNAIELRFEENAKAGSFRAVFAESEEAAKNASTDKALAARSAARRQKLAAALDSIVKKAQMPTGGGMGMAPEGGPLGGGGTTLPPGPADTAMAPAPVETFEAGMEGDVEDMAEEFEPSPPGTRCPVCGSDDVDVENGAFKCNNCKSSGSFSINMKVDNWAGTLEDNEGGEEDEEGEGIELGAEEMPLAASVYNIGKTLIKKAIAEGEGYLKVGEYCPNCGSDNTFTDTSGNGRCYNCAQLYISKIAHKEGRFKGLTIWQPLAEKPECPACMAKKASETLVDERTIRKFAKTKDNSKYYDCMRKIAKKYGPNAVALSGNCAGQALADCVCGKLKEAGLSSDVLMYKVASRLLEKDPMEECVEDHVRNGMEMKEACAKCEELKKEALRQYPEEQEVEAVAECGIECADNGLIFDEIDSFENDMAEVDPLSELAKQIENLVDMMATLLGKEPPPAGGDDDDVVDIIVDDDEDTVDEIIEDIDNVQDKEELPQDEDEIEDSVEFEIEDSDEDEIEDSDEDEIEDSDEDEIEDSVEFEKEEENDYDEEDDDDETEGCGSFPSNKKGEKTESSNNTEEDLNRIAQKMSSKTIRRYADEDSLSTLTAGDTMQINDLLGDRKISDTPAEKDVQIEKSQDVSDIGQYKDGKPMDGEDACSCEGPDVPQRGNASKLQDSEVDIATNGAKVPAGKGTMDGEAEIVDTEVKVNADGIAASSTKKALKTAGDKKVEAPKPVDQSKNLKNQKLKDKMEMGGEREAELTPDTLEKPDVPEDSQTMDDTESKDFKNPSVPAGGGGMHGEDETVGTDVSVETKGTVIAQEENNKVTEAKVRAERIKLATKLAALELVDGQIEESEYEDEVEKLATSSVPTLKTLIERYTAQRAKILASAKAVREIEDTNNGPTGLETPLLIGKEASKADLKDQIMGLFSLEQKIRNYEDE